MNRLLMLVLASLLLFLGCISFQLPPTPSGRLTQKEFVYSVNGTKDDLFVKANLWAVDIFNNAESVIQYSDKEAGVIAGKYITGNSGSTYNEYTGSQSYNWQVRTTVKVKIKDNEALISFSSDTLVFSEEDYEAYLELWKKVVWEKNFASIAGQNRHFTVSEVYENWE